MIKELHLAITPEIVSWDIVSIFRTFHCINWGNPSTKSGNTDNFTTSAARCSQMQLHANMYIEVYNTQVQTDIQILHTCTNRKTNVQAKIPNKR